MPKVDLHTHSTASPDGGISAQQYRQMLHNGVLDYIAITDHNRIDLALELHQELGDVIIVGEEIMTTEGEIVGLYLTKHIHPGLSPEETVAQIKSQGGLVYIPHPFETVRKGLPATALEQIQDNVDIIEVCNGRALFQNRGSQAVVWGRLHHVAGAASSDAHGSVGVGRTYSELTAAPSAEYLVEQLQSATLHTQMARLRSLLYPKYHRLRRKLGGKS